MDKDALIQARWGVLREKLKKSPNVLGTEAGLGNGTAGKWTDRHLEKHTAQVEKFLKHYRIDPVWWKTGNGEPFLQTESHGRFIDAEVWEELRSSHKFIIGTAGMYQH